MIRQARREQLLCALSQKTVAVNHGPGGAVLSDRWRHNQFWKVVSVSHASLCARRAWVGQVATTRLTTG